jgi:hypothetical protein
MLLRVQDSRSLLVLLLLATAVALVQAWLLARRRRSAHADEAARAREAERQAAAQARSRRATEGEREASALLVHAGYCVLARQVQGVWTVRADGEPLTFGLRADYLVARGGRRYVAEVKTGRLAPRLSHGPTRRQLLEYGVAFDVAGVLLVDAEAQSISLVEVDLKRSRAQGGLFAAATVVAVALFAAGLVLGTALGR